MFLEVSWDGLCTLSVGLSQFHGHGSWLVCKKMALRVALHYGGEVHWSVRSFSPRHGYLRQGMVCRRRVGVLRRSSFLSEALRLPEKLDLHRTPLLKSVRHVGILVIFSSMYNVLHQRTLGCSVNPQWTRLLLPANQILEFT